MEFFKDSLENENVKELELVRKFKSHNVIRERVELYKDFTINLLNYIHDTYLGKEYINREDDITGHFNWAFKKVLDEFDEEDINFYGNDELYDYFYLYYYSQFYKKNKLYSLSFYEKFWSDIFNVTKSKDRKEVDVFLELYEIFDQSLTIKHTDQEIFA